MVRNLKSQFLNEMEVTNSCSFLFVILFNFKKTPANIEWVEDTENIRLENGNGCIIAATSCYSVAY